MTCPGYVCARVRPAAPRAAHRLMLTGLTEREGVNQECGRKVCGAAYFPAAGHPFPKVVLVLRAIALHIMHCCVPVWHCSGRGCCPSKAHARKDAAAMAGLPTVHCVPSLVARQHAAASSLIAPSVTGARVGGRSLMSTWRCA
jgi:hypothetical protein